MQSKIAFPIKSFKKDVLINDRGTINTLNFGHSRRSKVEKYKNRMANF